MKGYKFLFNGYKSQYGNFTYEIGKTYIHNGEIELCKSGFHFSKTIKEAIRYVNGDICVEVEAGGEIIKGNDKCVCSEIKIIRELNIKEVLEMLSKNKNWHVKETVAQNQNTPIEILKKLSEDENWHIKEMVAENLNTPIEILERLSEDKSYLVREAVAENKNTPIKVLKKLSKDKGWWIKENAIENLRNRR